MYVWMNMYKNMSQKTEKNGKKGNSNTKWRTNE